MNSKLIFQYGVEGGGCSVYQTLDDGSIIENGSSGGILDEEEDPIINWNKKYNNWEMWWNVFIKNFQSNWIRVHPTYIDISLKDFFITEISNYKSDELDYKYYCEKWLRILK